MSLNSTTPFATDKSTADVTRPESESRLIRERASGDLNKSESQAVGERTEVSEPVAPADVAVGAGGKPQEKIMQFREALEK